MLRNRLLAVLGLVLIASMVLSACGTATPAEPQVIVQTQVVEVEKIITPTPGPAESPKLSFTTPHPILSDVRVRQALAYCTNKLDLVKASYPLNSDEDNAKLPMNTFIPASSWAYAGDENVTIYPFDAAKGAALLEEAGWALNADDGLRYNAAISDQPLTLHFTTTNAKFRQTWAAVWENQMLDCGVLIIRQHVPASWWFGDATGVKRRDFELGAFAWVGQPDPGGQTLYACDQIPTVENVWTGQNGMGWCNPLASDNIKIANNTLIKADRQAAYKIVQQEFTKDVPSIPLFNRSSYYAWNKDFTGLSIAPGDQDYYTWNPEAWEIKGKDTIVLGFTQEPSTLFQPLVDAIVARYASQLITGLPFTSQNYDYQPVQQKQLATIENGAATNADIQVKAGDKVVNAAGEIITLDAAASPAQKVKDSTGAEVEFKGDPITMKQMTVKYEFIDGMTFSDGVPLAQEDFELGYKVQCDKEVGATSYILCDMVQSNTFDGLNYTIVWLPGRQDPTYFLAPFGWYPAHQVVATEGAYKGKKLSEVAPKDFNSLPEVSEKPMDVGPYMITEWKKGEFIKYEVNPYFYGAKPKTKTIIIQIVASENSEAQLLGGQIDLLDSSSVLGISQTLKDAADAGKVVIYLSPSPTWEHIDINMFLK
jgi:ABC-type transport system substrate-binding protein